MIACDVMAATLVVWNNKIFLLWELSSIFMQYANYVSKFSFVFTSNRAAMQSTYRGIGMGSLFGLHVMATCAMLNLPG